MTNLPFVVPPALLNFVPPADLLRHSKCLDLIAIERDIKEQNMLKLHEKVDCHEGFIHTLSVKRKKSHSTFIFQNPLLWHPEN